MYTSLYCTVRYVQYQSSSTSILCTALHCSVRRVRDARWRWRCCRPNTCRRAAPRRAAPHERAVQRSAVQCGRRVRMELSRLDLQLSVRSSRNESSRTSYTSCSPLGSRLSLTLTLARSRSQRHLTSTVTLQHSTVKSNADSTCTCTCSVH